MNYFDVALMFWLQSYVSVNFSVLLLFGVDGS